MSVVVLGARGMVGCRLVPLLRGGGIETRTAGRSQGADVAFDWDGDLRDPALLHGAEALFLVPPAMVADPSRRVAQLLDAARYAGVTRVVAVSSLGVSFPTEPADSGRHRFERAISASGLDWTILRPAEFMQNLTEGFMAPMIAAGTVLSATGSGQSATVDAGDIAAVALAALTGPGPVNRYLALTGPELMDSATMTRATAAAIGRPIRHERVDETQMSQMMLSGGIPADYAEILLRDQRAVRDGLATVISDDIASVLGRPPRSFNAFLADEVRPPA